MYSYRKTLKVPGLPFDDGTKFFIVSKI